MTQKIYRPSRSTRGYKRNWTHIVSARGDNYVRKSSALYRWSISRSGTYAITRMVEVAANAAGRDAVLTDNYYN